MAVVKSFACDLCGAAVDKLAVRIARVGMVEDRPEDCDRLDIGPECYGEGGDTIASVIRAWMKVRAERPPEYEDAPLPGWIPLDPDGLPPETYPAWRKHELARREAVNGG